MMHDNSQSSGDHVPWNLRAIRRSCVEYPSRDLERRPP